MNTAEAAIISEQARFQQLLEEHKRLVFKVVSTYAWHSEDQQDLAQDIRLQLWRSFPRYDSARNFSTWMYQVALNTAISWSRQSKARAKRLVSGADLALLPAPIEPEDSNELYVLIQSLDELSRALLVLYIDERSHAEIGEILGLSTGNVATKISRLKARLRIEAADQN